MEYGFCLLPLPSDMQPGAPPRTEEDDAEADDEGDEDAIVVHGHDGAPLSKKERRKFDATLRALMPGGTVDPLATSSAPPPIIIPRADEEKLVTEVMGDAIERDLILIPQSQLDANDRFTPHPIEEPPGGGFGD